MVAIKKDPDCPVRSRDSKLKPRISSDCSILTLASFWLVDPDVEGKFLPSGQLTIHYVGGTAVQLGEVAIRFHRMTLEALWPQEVASS